MERDFTLSAREKKGKKGEPSPSQTPKKGRVLSFRAKRKGVRDGNPLLHPDKEGKGKGKFSPSRKRFFGCAAREEREELRKKGGLQFLEKKRGGRKGEGTPLCQLLGGREKETKAKKKRKKKEKALRPF